MLQIAQDDDGFDLASRDSLDLEDADLVEPQQNGVSKPVQLSAGETSRGGRDISPLPAPIPTKPATVPRASLEGETMFAIEDEDRFSDDELTHGDASEREHLTAK